MATVSGHAALVRFSMILVGLAVLAVAGDELDRVIPQLEQWIADRGALAPVGFIVLTLVCVPLLAPDTLFGVMAGVLFGVGLGTLCFFVGSYLGCVVSYELARGLLRKRVADRVRRRPKLAAVRAAARREGLRITALLRLTPLSAALVSYLLGAAKVSRPRFLVGTLALLPAHFVTVYFGVVAKHVTKMAAQGHAAWDLQGRPARRRPRGGGRGHCLRRRVGPPLRRVGAWRSLIRRKRDSPARRPALCRHGGGRYDAGPRPGRAPSLQIAGANR